jgi:hypothetical protein
MTLSEYAAWLTALPEAEFAQELRAVLSRAVHQSVRTVADRYQACYVAARERGLLGLWDQVMAEAKAEVAEIRACKRVS